MTLEQKIIELVKLSAIEGVGDAGFSSPCIGIGTRSLIRIKYVSKSAKYIGQLFIIVFSLRWSLDYKWVKDVSLLAVVVLVIGLVGASSQLGLLFTGTILGLGIGETVWPG